MNVEQFGKLGSYPVDGQVYAQPLYASGVPIAGRGFANVVYIATMHNSVYAFDADAPCSSKPLWHVNFGRSLRTRDIFLHEISPEIGILSTPVIDLASNAIYAVAATDEKGATVYRLHALDLSDGQEKLNGPVAIRATVDGDGDANQKGRIDLDASQHLQRPALLLANNSVYIAFGSIHDRFPYHGWILAYDATNLQKLKAAFNVTPEGGSGGIWQSGRGLAADVEGNIYAVTGNGDFDGAVNFGESFIKLNADLRVLDWFAPADWRALSDVDYDLGSLGPVLVPGTSLVLGGDKASNMYLVDGTNMGHLGRAGAALPQIFEPIAGSGLYNTAVWPRGVDSIAYIAQPGDWTGAFRIEGGTMDPTPISLSPIAPEGPFAGMAVSSNGAGRGILWITDGDQSEPSAPGRLLAFDALDLGNLLWTSDMFPIRDAMGSFAKFANPTVANGRVYVPTFSNSVAIYGLLQDMDGDFACQSALIFKAGASPSRTRAAVI